MPKSIKVNLNLDTKVGKYFVARTKGMKKGEAALAAGYADVMHTPQIEKSKTFKELEKMYFKDALLMKISMPELAKEMTKVIRQDDDLGAKNTAMKMALDKIEPETRMAGDDNRVLVVLSDPNQIKPLLSGTLNNGS